MSTTSIRPAPAPSTWRPRRPPAGPLGGAARFTELDVDPAAVAGVVFDPMDRRPGFVGVPGVRQDCLSDLRVTIYGLGGVGRYVALALARLGVRALMLCDPGSYKPASLATQDISPRDVGQPKASNTGRLCKAINPCLRVGVYDGPLQDLATATLADADVLVVATDDLAAELEAGQRAMQMGTPLLQASVHGETLVAHVRTFAMAGGAGPCPGCLFGPPEWRALHAGTRYSCEGAGSLPGPSGAVRSEPTVSLASLCSLAADLLVLRLVPAVLRAAPALILPDAVLEYCAFRPRIIQTEIRRKTACACDHTRWTRRGGVRDLARRPLESLLADAGVTSPFAFALSVDERRFAVSGACGCSRPSLLRRFLGPEQAPGLCPACGAAVQVAPHQLHLRAPGFLFEGLLGRPLAELGAPRARSVLVEGREASVLFTAAPEGAAPLPGDSP